MTNCENFPARRWVEIPAQASHTCIGPGGVPPSNGCADIPEPSQEMLACFNQLHAIRQPPARPLHLDLFSGIGGFALAAESAGFKTVAFCEQDPYAQRTLIKNFRAVMADSKSERKRESPAKGNSITEQRDTWPEPGGGSPILHEDIRTLNGADYRGVDLVTGGFPCQPYSLAGQRRGAADDRALWPEMCRVIEDSRPAWVLGENVPGIIGMELDRVLSDLEGLGYAC